MKTILWISSNKERPEFEKKIIKTLLENCGDLPIVAVTQKPVDLGPNSNNIVVGEQGASGFNFCRQLQIGIQEVKTKYVISAESDCIYPPSYFKFIPPEEGKVYRNRNIYVLKYKQPLFKKRSSTYAQVADTKFFRDRLNYLFSSPDLPMWNLEMFSFPKEIGLKFLDSYEYFETDYACISFKTGQGMRLHTVTKDEPIYELPYWGTLEDLRKKYL
jgi:hypothetical protein